MQESSIENAVASRRALLKQYKLDKVAIPLLDAESLEDIESDFDIGKVKTITSRKVIHFFLFLFFF